MKCPSCLFVNPDDAKFCMECGSKLELACPKCGKVIPAGSKFCMECGHGLQHDAPLRPTGVMDYSNPKSYTPQHLTDKILQSRSAIVGERKTVTVLFADLAGYTSISEKLDPEEVHRMMDGCFHIMMDEIHKYEGTITQFTGDGLMALFGAPLSLEDHAIRACRSALGIQKALMGYASEMKKRVGIEFRMRIGLNTGPVLVGMIGDDLRMDYTALGDTVNLASRMESNAKPGGTLVSVHTYNLARYYLKFQSLGKIKVKGKAEPQEVYELLGTGDATSRFEASVAKGLTRFVGRKNSISILMEAWNKVRMGEGRVVGIVGEAGVGKSRLLLEYRKRISEENSYFEGRCLQFGGSMAFLPIKDFVRSYFRIEEGEPESSVREKLNSALTYLGEPMRITLFPFQELLSLEVKDTDWNRMEPNFRREKIFEALKQLFLQLSRNIPLILAVEDLHWIDKTSEEFLNYLINSIPGSPILLLLLYRPEYYNQWGGKTYFDRIGLDQLSSNSSAELVQAVLGDGEVAPELRELILGRAAGNPLFMEELTHTLLENGAIEMHGTCFALSHKASDIQVPDTIQGIIASRMDRLEENLKRTIQVASVIGRDFAFRILQAITGMGEDLKPVLLNLQGLEFIYEKQLFPELEYLFKHALTQEVAYGSLLQQRRKELHGRIGAATERLYANRLEEFYEMLAYHYSRSGSLDKAVTYLGRSNQRAIKIGSMIEAKAFFDEAVSILDRLPETEENVGCYFSMLPQQFFVFSALLQVPEFYNFLVRIRNLVPIVSDSVALAAYYRNLGACEWWFGNLDRSIDSFKEAAINLDKADDRSAAGNYLGMQWPLYYKGDNEAVVALKDKVVHFLKRDFDAGYFVHSMAATSLAYGQMGQWADAFKTVREGMECAGESGNSSLVSLAARAMAYVSILQGDKEQAYGMARQALDEATTMFDKLYAQVMLAWAMIKRGDALEGAKLSTNLGAMAKNARYLPGEITTLVIAGEGYLAAEHIDKAKEILKSGLQMAESSGMKFFVGLMSRLFGEAEMETDAEAAKSIFARSLMVLSGIKAENELAMTYMSLGRLEARTGEISQARENLEQALSIFERLGTPGQSEKVKEYLKKLR